MVRPAPAVPPAPVSQFYFVLPDRFADGDRRSSVHSA